ncbi:MAG: relaxase domain-containing protein [Propionibacteriaceae bacterium]|nr:relaxase domain-containing protein [Propionibacteriaceae bacterium]
MSLKKLTAGSGYDYLTRQVAAMDSTEKGHTSLHDYYAQKGELPGRWIGAGMEGVEGLEAGDPVTAEQMRNLFGYGEHPLADERVLEVDFTGIEKQIGEGKGILPVKSKWEQRIAEARHLGKPYYVYDNDVSDYRIEVARRLQAANRAEGKPARAETPIEERARVRNEVATEWFIKQHRRPPLDERELHGFIAEQSRQKTSAVAGFDLTFSPVKSVSTLWAVSSEPTRLAIQRAHDRAVEATLAYIEREALFTRSGTNGTKIERPKGLVAAAFTHRDSRAGDPDLHTHVVVANKVEIKDEKGKSKWLTIHGSVLYRAAVSASEYYNTMLEKHLAASLGLRFYEVPKGVGKRVVREVEGVPPELLAAWSSRANDIKNRKSELVADFRAKAGRPPTPVEMIKLAQVATLQTRQRKHEPRSLAEQLIRWKAEAQAVLGTYEAVTNVEENALHAPFRVADDTPIPVGHAAKLVENVFEAVQAKSATWGVFTIRAEAERQIREANLAPFFTVNNLEGVVNRVQQKCVPISFDPDEDSNLVDAGRVEPKAVGGRYTSQQILNAEMRLIAHAGRPGGRAASDLHINLAFAEAYANQVVLNPGQQELVRQMAASGRRLQLGLAPAGSGKTTAMGVLTSAWQNSGGNVIGLAPSAEAAEVLQSEIGCYSETLAKLDFETRSGNPAFLPRQFRSIGPDTLAIIDEAGMADTLTLDRAVNWLLSRGATVRLIGDTQQLAAVGAGGVLRDIQATHGAVNLTELVRFSSTTEAAATIALREGDANALGYYFDHQRIHIGDETGMCDAVFDGWRADREAGLDSIMVAHSHQQVAELNQRARTLRLADEATQTGEQVSLSDGNQASAGDTIISRRNARKLATSSTDWVKNGDKWTVLEAYPDGRLKVRRNSSRAGGQAVVILPADYVAEHVTLGYATTVHTAQGVTADTMHGLVGGLETRQLFYTMMTRGRDANHAYVTLTGDGDAHSAIYPEVLRPLTATDVLEQILNRDQPATSATTQQRQAKDPRKLLKEACDRYHDTLFKGVQTRLSETDERAIIDATETLFPGVTYDDAWPALANQLYYAYIDGRDPIQLLLDAADLGPTDDAENLTKLLTWRTATLNQTGGGPLPWLPAIPEQLRDRGDTAKELEERHQQIVKLAAQIGTSADGDTAEPIWVKNNGLKLPPSLTRQIEIYRAGIGLPKDEARPLGEPPEDAGARIWRKQLNKKLTQHASPAVGMWLPLLQSVSADAARDEFAPAICQRLAHLSSIGIDIRELLEEATATPLPDHHAAGALWWRIVDLLPEHTLEETGPRHDAETVWLPKLTQALGQTHTDSLTNSTWWPALSATIERALECGNTIGQISEELTQAATRITEDAAIGALTRLSHLTEQSHEDPDEKTDPWQDHHHDDIEAIPFNDQEPEAYEEEPTPGFADTAAARARIYAANVQPPTIETQTENLPADLDRLAEINEMAASFYEAQYRASWASPYLKERCGGIDLAGHPYYRPGYAPASWDALLTHLRTQGVNDEEMIRAGLAKRAETGRLRDVFVDRLVLPVTHDGKTLGFTARRNPAYTDDDHRGPKYLNTADTPLFAKGQQLYGTDPAQKYATPVLVEGALDAIAVTVASDNAPVGSFYGVAPLGSALTLAQTRQLANLPGGGQAVIATDADQPGKAAAMRAYWLLSALGITPKYAPLQDAKDPGEYVQSGHGNQLAAELFLAADYPDTILKTLTGWDDQPDPKLFHIAHLLAVNLAAAAPPEHWERLGRQIANQFDFSAELTLEEISIAAEKWNRDPAAQTREHLANTRHYIEHTQKMSPVKNDMLSFMASILNPAPDPQPPAAAPAEEQPQPEPNHTPRV